MKDIVERMRELEPSMTVGDDCKDAADEIERLRAKIDAMENQEPVGKFIQHPSHGMWEQDGYSDNPDAKPLYLAPGAKGE